MKENVKTSKKREVPGTTGIVVTGHEKGLKRSSEEPKEIQPMVSITPFPNIDQVKSESTNLIDSSANQLHKLMLSVGKAVIEEENPFKAHQNIMSVAHCAKQIASLLRVKLDIYKEYRKDLRDLGSSDLVPLKPKA